MMVIGITGGIASGKSHVLSKVKSLGAYVVDCDTVVRQLSRPGCPLHTVIVQEFGDGFLNADGEIDKGKLRAHVFANQQELDKLNRVSTNVIRQAVKEALIAASDYDVVFVEGIRVFEEGFCDIFDEIWFVYCNEAEQLSRLMERDGINVDQAMDVLERQRKLMESKDKADVLICTDGKLSDLFDKVQKLYMGISCEDKKKRKKRQKEK